MFDFSIYRCGKKRKPGRPKQKPLPVEPQQPVEPPVEEPPVEEPPIKKEGLYYLRDNLQMTYDIFSSSS